MQRKVVTEKGKVLSTDASSNHPGSTGGCFVCYAELWRETGDHGVRRRRITDVLEKIVTGRVTNYRLDALLPWRWTCVEGVAA